MKKFSRREKKKKRQVDRTLFTTKHVEKKFSLHMHRLASLFFVIYDSFLKLKA